MAQMEKSAERLSTKDRIVRQATLLFGARGYEEVSIRQIAAAVGIRPASIYGHFDSKEQILDEIVERYIGITLSYHPKLSQMKRLVHTQSPQEVLRNYHYVFAPEDMQMMLYMHRIVYSEQYRNRKIRTFVIQNVLESRIDELAELLNYMMKLGKIPQKNAFVSANIWVNVACIMAMKAAHNMEEIYVDLSLFEQINESMIEYICCDMVPPKFNSTPDYSGVV